MGSLNGSATTVADAQQQLLDDPKKLARLTELRGWTTDAIRTLGLGVDRDRILIPVVDDQGELAGLLRYQPNPDKREGLPKMMAAPGSTRELFPAVTTLPADATIWLVEGEADAVAAHSIGLPATAVPGTGGWQTDWATRFADRDVVVCCDCDQPGRGLAQRIADDLVETAASVRIVDLSAARDDGYDLSDFVREAEPSEYPNLLGVINQVADDCPVYLPLEDRPPRPRLTIADWRNALIDYLDGKTKTPAWKIPFPDLAEACDGGIRPGELWILAGWTSNGKSVLADMFADSISEAGGRVHLYLTEMTVVQRGLRAIARRGKLPLKGLRRLQLTDRQRQAAKNEVARLPYAASVVTDWSPKQVAADIRASRTNVAIIDLLHGFDYQDERQLSQIVSEFAKAATSDAGGLDGSAIVLLCQLNDGQMRDSRGVKRPKPGMHSLKGSSWIKQLADVVMFVWLEDDDDGVPTTSGEVWIAKNRNGGKANVNVELDDIALVFEERKAVA